MSEGNLFDFIFYFLPTDLSMWKASGFRNMGLGAAIYPDLDFDLIFLFNLWSTGFREIIKPKTWI